MTPHIPSEIERIYSLLYADNENLLATVLTHSECVARKAIAIAEQRNLDVDKRFVYEAAMLHDVGVVKCDAPSIFCYGSQPYIRHGIEGARILTEAGMPLHALVCERHTGAGITIEDIQRQALPLPLRDFCPQSLEEKLICYADKFFSKSGNLTEEKPLGKVFAQMERFGPDVASRFAALHNLFG